MDVTFDPAKNEDNIKRHSLPLSLGGLVLADIQCIERWDDEHSTPSEERYQTIGLAGKVLFTVYTERGDKPHIISVRLADTEERRLYYGYRNLLKAGWYRVNPGGNEND
jgi:uncharacterized DUF497 family protein